MALDSSGELRPASRALALVRIGVGLAQGAMLYALVRGQQDHYWPAPWMWLFEALVLAALVMPLVFIGGVGALRRNTLIAWTAVAGPVAFGLGAYDVLRQAPPVTEPFDGPPILMAATGVLMFIAHHLVAGADADRRLVARYPTYFDIAWKHGVQLALSGLFVGVFWAVMFLGAALFKIIGIEALETLIRKEWFVIPATTTMFAVAIQLTDIRVALIRGVRAVVLTLLAWLLPLMAVLAAAFLLALPFEGLKALWETNRATALLLGAAAVLIVLINTAYQEGRADAPPPLVVRWAARLGAVVIAPLVALAAYAVALRIGQHGLTPERVIGAACVFVGAFYAVGYLIAAVRPGPWLKTLEPTNVITAFVAIVVLLALFTPIADPARMSADDQLKRIARNGVPPEKIDYEFLRFGAGRYGVGALEKLRVKGGEAGKRAGEMLTRTDRYTPLDETPATPAQRRANITVYPKGVSLPDDFYAQDWGETPGIGMGCLTLRRNCEAVMADLNADGRPEVLLFQGEGTLMAFERRADGKWLGFAQIDVCQGMDEVRKGRFKVVEPGWKGLQIGEERYGVSPRPACMQSSMGAPPQMRHAGKLPPDGSPW